MITGSRNILTARQAEVLAVIQTYSMAHGYPPSIRDLGRILDIGSTNGVRSILHALVRKGRIRRDAKIARSITITQVLTTEERSLLRMPA